MDWLGAALVATVTTAQSESSVGSFLDRGQAEQAMPFTTMMVHVDVERTESPTCSCSGRPLSGGAHWRCWLDAATRFRRRRRCHLSRAHGTRAPHRERTPR